MKKKVVIIVLAILVAVAIIIGIVLLINNGAKSIKAINLNPNSLEMTVGEEKILSVSVEPDTAANSEITWSSSNPSVVAVEKGKVKAVAVGTATVTATAVGGKQATCLVTVTESVVSVKDISLNKPSLSLKVGEKEELWVIFNPSNATDKHVTWNVDNTAVITVEKGKVTAVSEGTATITATAVSCGKTATCVVTVTADNVAVNSVSLDKSTLEMVVDDRETLVATVLPANAANKGVSWSVEPSGIVSVDTDGNVVAISAGTATITVTTADGSKTAACVVTVTAKNKPVTDVALSQTSLSLEVGQAVELTATVYPADATNKAVTWESSNPSVVSVENGKVTAVAVGTARITVITDDGSKTAYCAVTVSQQVITVESVSLNKNTLTLYIGYSETLVATVLPGNAANKELTWSSDNTSVANVHDDGSIYALKAGTATITVTTADGNKTATCVVTVPDPLQYYQVVDDNEVVIAYGVSGLTPENIDKVSSVIIPAQHDGLPVTHIANEAFLNNKVSSVTIPTTITFIGSNIFKARYPSVTYEGTLADWCAIPNVRGLFESWPYETYVSVMDEATGEYVRLQNEELTNLIIPDGVTSIGSGAFLDTYLTTLELPASITSLGEFAISHNITIKYNGDVSGWCQIEGIDGFVNSYYSYTLTIDGANVATLNSISISQDVTKITKSSLSHFTALQAVYFDGTSEQWSSILSADSGLVATATVYCLKDPVACPIKEDQIIKVPVGTLVSALYETYPDLTVQDDKWQLYMYYLGAPFADENGYIQLGDTQTMPEGEFDCKLVYRQQVVNFVLIGLPECPIPNGSSMEGTVGAEIGELYQGYPTLINDYGKWTAYMYVNEDWVKLDNTDTIPSEGEFQFKLVFEGENIVIKPTDVEFTIVVDHSLQFIEPNDATCNIDGNIEYYVCEQCGKFFSDASGKNEISDKSSVKIAANGHDYDVNGICTICGAKQPTYGLLYELSEDGTYAIVKGIGTATETDLVVADSYQGVPVTCIDQYAFMGKPITSIDIPDSVTSIGEGAFAGCEFTSITIPRGLTSISRQLFSSCSSLTTVIIHNGVTNIEWHAFYNCDALVSIIMPNSVTSVGDDVVGSCDSFTTVYYIGTEEDWSKIDIGESNKLNTATRYYYFQTRPDEEGNYWCYDTDGVTPVIW